MNYEIAIPSYKRAETLKNNTLKLLSECHIPHDRITVFVADKEQYKIYKGTIGDKYKIIIGQEGMGAIRNFIQDHYPEGSYVLEMDDDIQDIGIAVNSKKMIPFRKLEDLIKAGFSKCLLHKTRLWGVYPVYNSFFMKNKVDTDLRYIVGCFFGLIITHDDKLKVTMDDKEDFERTIKYYQRYGKVIRFRNIAVKTNYYGEPGGMQETRTEKRVEESAKLLLRRYPQYCEFNPARKNHFEIKLKDKTRG